MSPTHAHTHTHTHTDLDKTHNSAQTCPQFMNFLSFILAPLVFCSLFPLAHSHPNGCRLWINEQGWKTPEYGEQVGGKAREEGRGRWEDRGWESSLYDVQSMGSEPLIEIATALEHSLHGCHWKPLREIWPTIMANWLQLQEKLERGRAGSTIFCKNGCRRP